MRREREWSQERLAERAGINATTVVHLEKGKVSPTVETLEKLAQALDVNVVDIFPKAEAPLEGRFSETEVALAEAYLEQRRNARRLLGALRSYADGIARSWEVAGREISLDEIRGSLSGLEGMLEARIPEIRRSRHNTRVEALVDTRALDTADDLELEMLSKAVARLRAAAEPVLEREQADRE